MDSYLQPGAHGSYRPTIHYVSMAIRDVATQLSEAGVRLAWLLNRALGSAS